MIIVEDHQPQASIVVAAGASEQVKAAAKTLQTYLQKSTGATLPLGNVAQGQVAIHVGLTAYAKTLALPLGKLDKEGFILQGGDARNFIIAGGSDLGTEYAVYDFLERYVGIRWLLPGEIGEDIPQRADLNIPVARVLENPAYLLRYFWTLEPSGQSADDPYPRYPSWARQNRINNFSRISFHHNLLHLFPPSVFAKSNPEFYPLLDGKRYIPQNDAEEQWQPNFSAPGIVDAAVAQIDKYFQEHPDAGSYSLGMNDSPKFDESPASKTRRNGKRNSLGKEDVSDDYFRWANEVVEKVLVKYPDKWFGTLAYDEIADPPTTVKVHPRIVPFLTYERLFWLDPALKAHNQKLQARWEQASAILGWYDYHYGMMYMAPRVHLHQTQAVLQYGTKHKVRFHTAELFANWGEGPKPWVLSKLLWNPNANLETLMDDWCNRAVGAEATPKLKTYYANWERFWTKDIVGTAFWNKSFGVDKFQRQYLSYNDLSYLNEIPESIIVDSDRLMNEVVQLAKTPLQKQRAQKLALMWEFYKTSYYAYQGEMIAAQTDSTNPQSVLDGLEKADVHLAALARRREIMESFKDDPLFHDVYLRVNPDGNRGSDVKWGHDLVLKAGPLARANDAVLNKLEALAHSQNTLVQKLSSEVVLNARR
nr:beta-hexosaminidase precursor [uncultured bacterium]